ncbi:hypothetical protein PRBRB14_21840 [Hallella multisaccharivorax DSM 17128]|uniref:Uncharacterized protein n=1 Tax=Hallella multisaccharivorax DSM 17128 TaxID=688246 RepID=F8N7J3_9BACT|nr:hypothetical protein [Hallella multisaccharivorax]EGN57453.1 hypothetical protein Premu_2059 [Hallella multisaccharivorax DSM 17128]GJG31305.1 hypothetical protein PRBRB14_21840 [Hallella multisaccharivorax DSM 17128]
MNQIDLSDSGTRFFISGLQNRNWDSLVDKAFTIIVDGKQQTVKVLSAYTKDAKDIDCSVYVTAYSLSGISVWTSERLLYVNLPKVTSRYDIDLCYNGLKYIAKQYPKAKIQMLVEGSSDSDDATIQEADLSAEATKHAYTVPSETLKKLIISSSETVILPGVRRSMAFAPKFFQTELKDRSDEEKVEMILDAMIDLQWLGEVEPRTDLKTFLMRWNPEISNFKKKDYNELLKAYNQGKEVGLSWSVYDYMQLSPGDECYMMCVGGKHKGIVLHGIINSYPLPDKDWSGNGRKTFYANIIIDGMAPLEKGGIISEEQLKEKVTSFFDWGKGHSGVVLNREISDRLNEVIDDLVYERNQEEKDTLYFNVDKDTFEAAKNGLMDHVTVNLTEENKENFIVAHEDGIALNVKELPMYSYGAYLCNEGKFPYVLNPINRIHLSCNDKNIEVKVRDITTEATNRFRFDDEQKMPMSDPQGKGCMWKITYHF